MLRRVILRASSSSGKTEVRRVSMDLSGILHRFIARFKYLVILFWAVALGFSAWLGPAFLDHTSMNFDAPSGSPAYIAQKLMDENFPQLAERTPVIVFIRSNSSESVLRPSVRQFTYELRSEAFSWSANQTSQPDAVDAFQSFFTLNDTGLGIIADKLVSTDGHTSTLISITIHLSGALDSGLSFVRWLRSAVKRLHPADPDLTVMVTGEEVILGDVESSTAQDMVKTDGFVIPLAMLVLASVLRSVRLMIIPIVTIVCAMLISLALMYPISFAMDVASFAASVMMSACIAMSIDYSLFLLTRFREEVQAGSDVDSSVAAMSKHAGHTIFVSGSTLVFCFLGLAVFPLQLLSSVGIGSALSITTALLVNLTLTPALLLTFPNFFSSFGILPNCIARRLPSRPTPKESLTAWQRQSLMSPHDSDTEADHHHKIVPLRAVSRPRFSCCAPSSFVDSWWYKLGRIAVRFRWVLLILLIALAAPLAWKASQMRTTLNQNQIIPASAPSRIAYEAVTADFSAGLANPYYLLIIGDTPNLIKRDSYFKYVNELINEIIDTVPNTRGSNFVGISYANSTLPMPELPWFVAKTLLAYPGTLGRVYRLLWTQSANAANSSSLVSISVDFDPNGGDAAAWIDAVRVVIDSHSKSIPDTNSTVTLALAGAATQQNDAVAEVWRLFPYMLLGTIAVIFLIVMVMFRSVLVSLRLVITIAITVSIVYGCAVFVFQDEIFTDIFPSLAQDPQLSWVTPVMSFSITVGLSLDYDVLLLSRISEFRLEGYSTRAAVLRGLYKTGGIITAAGLIMTLAFAGLMFSEIMVLKQFSFFLCAAVLLDTFIVRTLLVPGLIIIFGEWTWWPRRMPNGTRDEFAPSLPRLHTAYTLNSNAHEYMGISSQHSGDEATDEFSSPSVPPSFVDALSYTGTAAYNGSINGGGRSSAGPLVSGIAGFEPRFDTRERMSLGLDRGMKLQTPHDTAL